MSFRINGQKVEVDFAPGATLLSVIRDQIGLLGTKESCGRGECGACTVLIDGKPRVSCITFAALVDGDVTTIEKVTEDNQDLQDAFAEFGGFQCGFCTAGQVVHAASVLDQLEARPVEDVEGFIRHNLSGNICRCTGYTGIVRSVVETYRKRQTLVAAKGSVHG